MAVPNEWKGTVQHFFHYLKSHSLTFKVRFQNKPQHIAHTSATRVMRAKNVYLIRKATRAKVSQVY
jgi:hypothetical protein